MWWSQSSEVVEAVLAAVRYYKPDGGACPHNKPSALAISASKGSVDQANSRHTHCGTRESNEECECAALSWERFGVEAGIGQGRQ